MAVQAKEDLMQSSPTNPKPRRGLEARIKPGQSLRLREGVELTNLGTTTILLSVKTLEAAAPIGRPNEPAKVS
jgi:hypothetical protein